MARVYLRALGRLTEAVEPMRAGLNMGIKQEDWKEAAIRASNLSELELTLGQVTAAITDGEQSVTFADRVDDPFEKQTDRVILADALHHAGRREESLTLFREAEAMQAKPQPQYPRLSSGAGFRYCDLLLSDAGTRRVAGGTSFNRDPTGSAGSGVRRGSSPRAPRWVAVNDARRIDRSPEECGDESPHSKVCDAVAERARQWFQWRVPSDSLLTIALDHLTLGPGGLVPGDPPRGRVSPRLATGLGRPDYVEAHTHIAAAVDGIRASGNMDDLPRASSPAPGSVPGRRRIRLPGRPGRGSDLAPAARCAVQATST